MQLARELHALLGAPRSIFLQNVATYGAVAETKRLIHSDTPSETFSRLWEKGRLDLTVEAIVVTDTVWNELFSDDDRSAARKRLEDHEWKGN